VNILLGGTKRAFSLAALARKCAIDPDHLERTVQDFADGAAQGRPDPLGKAADKTRPLGRGPYYAINFSMDNRFGPTFSSTSGGLVVDEQTGAVLGNGGHPIPGLYAAGRTAVGIPSLAQASGLALADNVFSGRRAARSAMATLADVKNRVHKVTISTTGRGRTR
jgi:3-oxo-5alpha-steroid 4-dehydrogenase